MHDLSPRGKGNSCLTKFLGRLNYEKIWRYNNSPPHLTARWPLQQIPFRFPWLILTVMPIALRCWVQIQHKMAHNLYCIFFPPLFICLLTRLFIHSFIHSFKHSIHSYIYPFIYIYMYILSITHSFIHLFIYSTLFKGELHP